MIDAYIWGEHNRMSPEAPVPVVDVKKREARLGGAANVALNINAAGAQAIICTVLGKAGRAEEYMQLMEDAELSVKGIVHSESRRCTVKTRVISNDVHMMRVDEEDAYDLNVEESQALKQRIDDILAEEQIDAVILQDYNKGVLTEELIEYCIQRCREKGVPTMVDPKKKNFMAYRDCSLFKPNLKELREGLGHEVSPEQKSLDQAIARLQEHMPHSQSLITLSEHGVYWNEQGQSGIIPVFERNIVDVSGAGDTVISLASLAIAAGASLEEASLLADLGGGLVCEEVGVSPIRQEALIKECLSLKL